MWVWGQCEAHPVVHPRVSLHTAARMKIIIGIGIALLWWRKKPRTDRGQCIPNTGPRPKTPGPTLCLEASCSWTTGVSTKWDQVYMSFHEDPMRGPTRWKQLLCETGLFCFNLKARIKVLFYSTFFFFLVHDSLKSPLGTLRHTTYKPIGVWGEEISLGAVKPSKPSASTEAVFAAQ